MSRHIVDLLEALAHASAPACQAARPIVAHVLRSAAALSLQLAWELWQAADAVAPVGPVSTVTGKPMDPRVNVGWGGRA